MITKQPESAVIIELGFATFNCEANGVPEPQIRWQRVNSHLSPSRSSVSPNGTLTIRDVYRSDADMYICVAENAFGIAKANATLVVEGSSSTLYQCDMTIEIFSQFSSCLFHGCFSTNDSYPAGADRKVGL